MGCCCCSVDKLCLILCDPMDCNTPGSLSFTFSWSFLRFISIESVMLYNHFILCCPLLLLPSVFPRISVFSSELALHIRWPKYWSFRFILQFILPVNIQGWFPLGMTGLISLLPKGLSRVFPSTTIQKHQFFNTQPSLWDKLIHLASLDNLKLFSPFHLDIYESCNMFLLMIFANS